MSKKTKKAMSMLLVVALIAVIVVGGMLAYLTDRDSEANVFTVGDVAIDLTEKFDQGATLTPGVDIEKEVKVVNTGKNDAWVWVTIAVPAALDNDDASKNVLHFNYSKDSVEPGYWNWMKDGKWNVVTKEIDGVDYNEYTVMYETALAAGAETAYPAMTKVYLDTALDITPEGDWYKVVNGNASKVEGWNNASGNPIVYVSAYAMQVEEFANVQEAYAAYQTQWGDNGSEYGNAISNAKELADFLKNGGMSSLDENITTDSYTVENNTFAIINLQGKTLVGMAENNGEVEISNGTLKGDYIQNNGVATFSDIKMESGSPDDYSNIATAGSETTYDNVDINALGGGIGAVEGAKVVFNSGSVAVNTKSTSGRYNFYAVGEGTEVTINGGDFSFSKTLNQKRAYIYAGAGATVYVNGGNFGPASTRSGYTDGILGAGTVIIKGGTFGFDPTKWVADGYQAVEVDGVWTVSAK